MSQEAGPTVARGRPRMIAGRYAVLNELGRGGMGVVWLAEDTMIGRHVAIKELHLPDGVPAAERAVFEERVLREARTAGRLNDPAVVTVYDVVPEAGTTYIVMELIQAPTLADVVRERGPLPQDQAAQLAEQLLSALETAHRAGIVHRDVKPSNIMLGANGRAKLTDFGIAQSIDDPRLTTSGLLVGSPAYLAPERLRGDEASAASDLWALGAVLFFAVEGYSPFERNSTAATMHAILNDVPYLTRGQGALASVITGLLIASPQARLNAAQVRGLLAHVRPATGPQPIPAFAAAPTAPVNGGPYPPRQHTQPTPPPKRPPAALVITLAALLALGSGVGGFFLNQAVNAPEQEQKPPVTSFTYGPGGSIRDFDVADGYCGQGRLQADSAFTNGTACDKPFDFQVFGYLRLDDNWTYAPDQLTALGREFCTWLASTNRIAAKNRAALAYTVLVPSRQTWDAEAGDGGSRTLHCVLSNKDPAKQLAESQVVEID